MKINKLKGLIVANNKNYEDCAKVIDISVSTFGLRIRKGLFTNKEIEKLSKFLNIETKEEIFDIFFDL